MRRIIFLTCLFIMPLFRAYGAVVIDGIEYNLDDSNKTAEITRNSSGNYTGSVVIPSQVVYNNVSYSVTSIGDWAFYDCSGLTSITIPKGVTSIGSSAFSGCSSLGAVYINSNAIVSKTYTYKNNLKSIFGAQVKEYILGDSITSIGEEAFYGCSGITSITIPNSVTSIGVAAFCGCSGLTSITILEGVTSIGVAAFADCSGLTSITIPEGVTSIEEEAFSECSSLTTITIPESVTSIGDGAFGTCINLTSINIPERVTSIRDGAFYECSSLTSINIPEGVTSIGGAAFYGCSGLTSIAIPEGVKSIGEYAFYECSSLYSVYINSNAIVSKSYALRENLESIFGAQVKEYTLGNSIASIGEEAFYGCSGITSITISEGVKSIGSNAFWGCSSLYNVYINSNAIVSKTYKNYNNLKSIFGAQVKEYMLGDSITSIGDNAFYGCSGLTSITLPNSVTSIGGSAFSGCSGLTSIAIPEGVTSIGGSAFSGCSGLTSITILEGVTSIGGSAFQNCSSLTSITIPESVTSIEEKAFQNCSSLTSITIPESVTSIGEKAFHNCSSLTSIKLPNSVTSIGVGAFSDCSGLSSITIPGGVTSIGLGVFSGCSSLTSIAIPNSVTSIGYNAFSGCSGITSITIPNSVTSIGYYAFSGCNSLTSITIPEGVTSIGEGAFWDCSGLTSITIPEGVTSIGYHAFYNCCNLTNINIPSGVPSIGNQAFSGCSNLDSVFINSNAIVSKTYSSSNNLKSIFGAQVKEYMLGDSITSIGDYAFYGCSALTSINIPKGVTSIGDGAFYECSGLTSITIPEDVTSIKDYAFYGCSGLTSINIPKGVTSIGDGAFISCDSLKTITIPTGVTSIGNDAFLGCNSLVFKIVVIDFSASFINSIMNNIRQIAKSFLFIDANGNEIKEIVIPEGVTSIGNEMFSGCSNLTSITIPESVTSIGDYAFYNCCNLTNINIPSGVPSIGNQAFSGCSNLDSVFINSNAIVSKTYSSSNNLKSIFGAQVKEYMLGDSITSIGDYAFYGCSALTSINIPKGVTSIGDYVFYECSGLTSIAIPEGVTNIKDYAFYGCSGLTSINIPKGVTSIGDYAFYECSGLTSITLPNNGTNIGSNALPSNIIKIKILVTDYSAFCNNKAMNCIRLSLNKPVQLVDVDGNEIKHFVIPDDVTSIGSYAFYNCCGLVSVTIPSSVTSIGEHAFYNCQLNTLTVGSGLLSIGSNAFSIKPIKTIWLANTPPSGYSQAVGVVNYAANDQYSSISNIKVYQFLSSIFEVDGIKYVPVSPSERICDAIDCCYDSSSVKVTLGKSVTYKKISMTVSNVQPYLCYGNEYIQELNAFNESDLSDYAFYDCTSLKKANISNIGSIGQRVFDGCSLLDSVIIANEGCIDSYAFNNCSALKEIILLNNGTIGSYAFSGCTSLKKVDFGNKVGSIGDYAFSNCSSLISVATPDSAVTIGVSAFNNCSSLNTIIIKNGITSVGDSAFSGCTSLTILLINDGNAYNVLTLGSKGSAPLFADCPLDSVYVGRNIDYKTSSIYGYSPFYRNTTLRSVVITDMETEISENEFYGCTNLKNVIVGDGVTNIGARAFSGCASLDNFSFGAEVASIGAEAFSDCTALTEIKSFAIVPPVCGNQALDDINKWECILSVPEKYISDYQAADQWKEFFFIVENEYFNKNMVYTLTFTLDGQQYMTYNVIYGDLVTFNPEPEAREGYTFSGWSEIPAIMPHKDVEIVGSYSINSYNLIYLINGEEYSKFNLNYATPINIMSEPTKEGYTFSGWSEIPASMPANDVAVTGSFTINKYLLIYKVDGETVSSDSIAYGTTLIAKQEPIKEGYTFSGWSEIPATMPANDVNVTGSFTINKYLLTYKVDGETVSSDSIAYGTTLIAKQEPTMEGYTFSGWSEIPATMPANDITVTGSFTINSYVITYMVDGKVFYQDTIEYNGTILLTTAPEKEGYIFVDWLDLPETMPAHDVTVTANFTVDDAVIGIELDGSYRVYDLTGKFLGEMTDDDLKLLKPGVYIINNKKIRVE